MDEKYNWKLTDIFKNDEEFNNSKNIIEDKLNKIEEYKGKLCDSAENLYNCYKLYEEILMIFEKVYSYGMFKYHLNMADQEGIKKFKEVESLAADLDVKTSFIVPEITYSDENKVEEFFKEKEELSKYKRSIYEILEKKEHILSKEEENLLANYSEVFSGPENIFDIMTNAEFKFGKLIDENGKEIELTETNYTKYVKSQNRNVRKQAFNLLYKKYSEYINTITEIYLTNVKCSSVTAKLRKYKSSLEEAVLNDDASIKVYEALMESINKNLSSNHEFIKLKKELLKEKDYHMYDLYVNPFENNEDNITFEEAKKEVLNALSVLGEKYTSKLQEAFDNNWIDVYEKPNKRGGAYSSGVYDVHPFVLMSFTNTKRDVSTIAHELGHSMHSYFAEKNQNILDSNYTIMIAEVASTVNEILLSEYQIVNEKDNRKKAEIIYELLEMIRATFFRQSMFAEFEKIIHEKIENGEALSSEDLNDIYYNLNQKYFGNNIIVDKEIQYEWARIPHFYSDFYVYKYATGISAAIYIANKILKHENGYLEKYIQMLSQGKAKKSIDLLKMVDVDLENVEVYDEVIKYFNEKMDILKKSYN